MDIYLDIVWSVVLGLFVYDGLRFLTGRVVRHRRRVILKPCGALGCWGCIEERVR